jgi:hypothetical protein
MRARSEGQRASLSAPLGRVIEGHRGVPLLVRPGFLQAERRVYSSSIVKLGIPKTFTIELRGFNPYRIVSSAGLHVLLNRNIFELNVYGVYLRFADCAICLCSR